MILEPIFICSAAIFLLMLCTFLVAVAIKNNTIVDVAWGTGFLLIAIISLLLNPHFHARQIITLVLIFLWASRLSGYLFLRLWAKPEDARYKQMRNQWGAKALWYSFIYVFMLQGALLLIIAYPIMLINTNSQAGLAQLDLIGVIIWSTGFIIESIADWQMYQFKSKPHTKSILTTGIWRYSRHPNYFGESLMWWGIFIIALNVGWGLTAAISPILLTFLLLFVSGIPLAEKQLESNPEFQEYKRKTSPFVPWFSKEEVL